VYSAEVNQHYRFIGIQINILKKVVTTGITAHSVSIHLPPLKKKGGESKARGAEGDLFKKAPLTSLNSKRGTE
jgi:hypothetical protein